MSPPFLEVFPREIRDQIYTFVLASPSGLVSLSPWTIEVARSLSLLQTSRQIHRECKDIIWLHNKLKLSDPTQLYWKLEELGQRRNIRKIREFTIDLEILDRDELEWIYKSLGGLKAWCHTGKLKFITLKTVWEKPRGIAEFKEVLTLRKFGETLDGRLCQEHIAGTLMCLNTGWPRFSHWGKQRWLKSMLLDGSGIEALLWALHELFGGDLYVNGSLCFKDGRKMQPCNLDPRNAEVIILPKSSP